MERVKCFDSKAQLDALLEQKKLLRLRIVSWNEFVVLGKSENRYFAAKDECPHARAPMSKGHINAYGDIVCPLHGYVFDTISGKVISGENCADLRIYKLEINDSGVWLIR